MRASAAVRRLRCSACAVCKHTQAHTHHPIARVSALTTWWSGASGASSGSFAAQRGGAFSTLTPPDLRARNFQERRPLLPSLALLRLCTQLCSQKGPSALATTLCSPELQHARVQHQQAPLPLQQPAAARPQALGRRLVEAAELCPARTECPGGGACAMGGVSLRLRHILGSGIVGGGRVRTRPSPASHRALLAVP